MIAAPRVEHPERQIFKLLRASIASPNAPRGALDIIVSRGFLNCLSGRHRLDRAQLLCSRFRQLNQNNRQSLRHCHNKLPESFRLLCLVEFQLPSWSALVTSVEPGSATFVARIFSSRLPIRTLSLFFSIAVGSQCVMMVASLQLLFRQNPPATETGMRKNRAPLNGGNWPHRCICWPYS